MILWRVYGTQQSDRYNVSLIIVLAWCKIHIFLHIWCTVQSTSSVLSKRSYSPTGGVLYVTWSLCMVFQHILLSLCLFKLLCYSTANCSSHTVSVSPRRLSCVSRVCRLVVGCPLIAPTGEALIGVVRMKWPCVYHIMYTYTCRMVELMQWEPHFQCQKKLKS